MHYIFVEGHLILIHKLLTLTIMHYTETASPSRLYITSLFSSWIVIYTSLFFLSVKLIRWVNDHRKSDLLSKQAGSCWCEDTNVSTHLDGSDIGNWLFRHIDAVLSLKTSKKLLEVVAFRFSGVINLNLTHGFNWAITPFTGHIFFQSQFPVT